VRIFVCLGGLKNQGASQCPVASPDWFRQPVEIRDGALEKLFLWALQMYYYQHNIGDFDKKTRHLTRIERSIYLDMMHLYYTTEQQLPLDVAMICRKVLARDEAEKAAVIAVLDEFFAETPNGWFHGRCEEELAAYRKTKSQASAAGVASAAAKQARRQQAVNGTSTAVQRPFNDRSTDGQRSVNETSTGSQREVNQPITNNQEPITKNQEPKKVKPKASPSALPDWLPMESWSGYLEMRKKIKKPPTERAIELLLAALDSMRGSGQDIAAVLDKSTMANWVDVYPIRDDRRPQAGAPLATQSRHSNFDKIDYREGIEDGRIT